VGYTWVIGYSHENAISILAAPGMGRIQCWESARGQVAVIFDSYTLRPLEPGSPRLWDLYDLTSSLAPQVVLALGTQAYLQHRRNHDSASYDISEGLRNVGCVRACQDCRRPQRWRFQCLGLFQGFLDVEVRLHQRWGQARLNGYSSALAARQIRGVPFNSHRSKAATMLLMMR
jgi:hypothetical protein